MLRRLGTAPETNELSHLISIGHVKKGNWEKVLQYIKQNHKDGKDPANPKRIIPIPSSSLVKEALRHGLIGDDGNQVNNTPLRIAISKAPYRVISALVETAPETVRLPDESGRIPLHYACRKPTGGAGSLSASGLDFNATNVHSPGLDNEHIIKVLIEHHPVGLIHRDKEGRTPLHELFAYHAASRGAGTLEMCMKDLGHAKKEWECHADIFQAVGGINGNTIPFKATIIPDERGCLPLHYAVSGGANPEIINTLVKSYPKSIMHGDACNRTPLHCYLMAGLPYYGDLEEPGKDDMYPMTGFSEYMTSIQAPPHKSTSVINLLLNRRIASMAGSDGRLILHWAVHAFSLSIHLKDTVSLQQVVSASSPSHKNSATLATLDQIGSLINSGLGVRGGDKEGCMSLRALKLMIEANRDALIDVDHEGQTPLHIFFSAPANWNKTIHEKMYGDHDVTSNFLRKYEPSPELVMLLSSQSSSTILHTLSAREEIFLKSPPKRKKKDTPTKKKDRNKATPKRENVNPSTNAENEEDAGNSFYDDSSTEATSSVDSLEQSVPPKQKDIKSTKTAEELEQLEETAAHLEDSYGRLPLHYAMLASSSSNVLQSLLLLHPASLFAPDYELCHTPLHTALATPYAAPLLSISELRVLLDSVVGDSNATPLDGSCALKIKDVCGKYPLHSACETWVKREILETLLTGFIDAVVAKDENGDLPIHSLFEGEIYFETLKESLDKKEATMGSDGDGGSGDVEVVRTQEEDGRGADTRTTAARFHTGYNQDDASCNQKNTHIRQEHWLKVHLLLKKMLKYEATSNTLTDIFTSPSSKFNMLPLHIAVIYNSPLDIILKLINRHPTSVGHAISFTHKEGYDYSYTATDFHYFRKTVFHEVKTAQLPQWSSILQILFGFHPMNSSYRRDVSVLNRCVSSIREEIIAKAPSSLGLCEVSARLWIFFTTYENASNPTVQDHYAPQVQQILEDLDPISIVKLLDMHVPESMYAGCAHDFSQERMVKHVANFECTQILYSYKYFAGRYQLPSFASVVGEKKENPIFHVTNSHLITRCTEYISFDITQPKMRDVCIKFIKHKSDYLKEVNTRREFDFTVKYSDNEGEMIPLPIVPIWNDYNIHLISSKRYASDIRDERFQTLRDLVPGADLKDYPYALTMPLCDKNLMDVLTYERSLNMEEVKRIGRHVGSAIKLLHDKSIIHCDVHKRNILRFYNEASNEEETSSRKVMYNWLLTDLGSSCTKPIFEGAESQDFVGEIGKCITGILPPEMFAKIETNRELKAYREYWSKCHNVDESMQHCVKPWTCPETGDTYIIKCFYKQSVSDENFDDKHPWGDETEGFYTPPYELNEPLEAFDIWSFAVLLYSLCSRDNVPLFPTNPHTGNLIDTSYFKQLAAWDQDAAEALVYENISDPLAQDILLLILSPLPLRKNLRMETVLCHPFFQSKQGHISTNQMIIQSRVQHADKFKMDKEKQIKMKRNSEVLEERTVQINGACSLETQMKMLHSPSQLWRIALLNIAEPLPSSPAFPLFILLPYKLIRNKSGKLTPASKKDVELAESVGKCLLHLQKACTFFTSMQKISQERANDWSNKMATWSDKCEQDPVGAATEILNEMNFCEDFGEIASELVANASSSADPIDSAMIVVQNSANALISIYSVSSRGHLYLVDEYDCVPVVHQESDQNDIYPMDITKLISPKALTLIVRKCLPMMHAGIMYVTGLHRGVEGLVKLIFEGAYPHIPGSWAKASKGLSHQLKRTDVISHINLLQKVLLPQGDGIVGRTSGEEDLASLQAFFKKFDVKLNFSGLKRVTDSGEGSLWTTEENVSKIELESEPQSIEEAYYSMKNKGNV